MKCGSHVSEETKRKMSKAKSGQNHPMFGKKHSEETKKKIGNAREYIEAHPFYMRETDEQLPRIPNFPSVNSVITMRWRPTDREDEEE